MPTDAGPVLVRPLTRVLRVEIPSWQIVCSVK